MSVSYVWTRCQWRRTACRKASVCRSEVRWEKVKRCSGVIMTAFGSDRTVITAVCTLQESAVTLAKTSHVLLVCFQFWHINSTSHLDSGGIFKRWQKRKNSKIFLPFFHANLWLCESKKTEFSLKKRFNFSPNLKATFCISSFVTLSNVSCWWFCHLS